MKIIIHNLLNDTNETYEGDVATLEHDLEADFSWAVEQAYGDLDTILYFIDHHPYYSVEVVDSSLHPFLKD
jgi:hypothetical protein